MMENLYVVEELARMRFEEQLELAERHRRTKAAEQTGIRAPLLAQETYARGKVVARATGAGEVPGL